MLRTIIAALAITALDFAGAQQRSTAGPAVYDIEGVGPESVMETLAPPASRTVSLSIQLRGDVTYTITHAPHVGSGYAEWYTAAPAGEPLTATVSFPGSSIPPTEVQFEAFTNASWGLPLGGVFVQFNDIAHFAPVVLENVPAWTSAQPVLVEFGQAVTDFETTAPAPQATFDLTQRVRIEVAPE